MDMDMGPSMVMCNTSMLWNWNTIDSCFLAESWHVSNNGIFAASCIGTVLLVMILEALRRLGREYDDWIVRGFQARAASLSDRAPPLPRAVSAGGGGSGKNAGVQTTVTAGREMSGGYGGGGGAGRGRTVVFRASPLQQVVRSVVHAVALGLAYIVMLLVMSYNGYIIICVIIGGGLGKFFCDWMTKRVVIYESEGDDEAAMGAGGGEEKSAGIEEPSMCCG